MDGRKNQSPFLNSLKDYGLRFAIQIWVWSFYSEFLFKSEFEDLFPDSYAYSNMKRRLRLLVRIRLQILFLTSYLDSSWSLFPKFKAEWIEKPSWNHNHLSGRSHYSFST